MLSFPSAADPSETRNIAGDNLELVKIMIEKLNQYQKVRKPPVINFPLFSTPAEVFTDDYGNLKPGWCDPVL